MAYSGHKWTIKGEWLYYDIGGKRRALVHSYPPTFLSSAPFNWDTKSTGHIARLGLNWHF